MATNQTLEQAKERHLALDFAAARTLYECVLTNQPGDTNVMFRLGVLEYQLEAYDASLVWLDAALAHAPNDARCHQLRGHVHAATGLFSDAIAAYRRALDLNPQSADVLFSLAAALQAVTDHAGAIEAYESVLALEPSHVDALSNLGNCHRQVGAIELAEAAYRRALALRCDDETALTNLGTLIQARGQLDEAIAMLREAVRVAPMSPYALLNLGVAVHQRGDFEQAAALLTRVIELDPCFPEAAYNLANAFQSLGRRRDALLHYRRAIEQKPAHADAYNNLGNVYKELGEIESAAHSFETAILLRPDFVAAYNNAATLMRTRGRLDDAEAHLRIALSIDPRHSATCNNLGTVLKDQGSLDEGVDLYRRALALDPCNVVAHSNLAYSLTFQAQSPTAVLDECRCWSARHEAPLRNTHSPHDNEPSPTRRLRIGYVSPDFRDHCQSLFMMPLLAHHDHSGFEIVCYASVERPDGVTRRIAGHADIWRNVRELSDERLAQRIREDRIDILIDLTMHMADGRPLLAARKPAPVQIAWLAYPGTTGIEAIDYRLTDPWLDPPGSDTFYSERSIRLPASFWCYDPLTDTPEVNALPALSNNYVTFGCLNNPCKLSDQTLSLWAQVLRIVDDARLLLMAPEGSARARLEARLEQHGIAARRVRFERFQPRADYLRTYHQIDLGLDTFPYNGHTTSLDSSWMGVPVVTRVGETAVGRAGLSQSMNLGLGELVTHSDADFVDTAVRLARDLPRLSGLREGLRARLAASPLMDGARFAVGVEAVYRQLWRQWCDTAQRSAVARFGDEAGAVAHSSAESEAEDACQSPAAPVLR
jgi:predicted O-linked N-acetylglucosamine transferase (SPINDLY family)